MVISFSGRTQELKLVLPHIPPTVPVIAITSHLHPSILSYNTSDIAIGLPAPVHEDEGSSFGVNAPTSSTTVALCLGDALALSTARRLHTSPTRGPAEVFKSFHPGGAIGASTAAAAAAAAGTATATTPMSMESSLSFSSPGEYLQGQQEQQQGQQDLLASHLLPLEKIPVVSPSGTDSEVRLLDAVLAAVQSPEAKSWVSLPSSSSPLSLALISPRNLRALSASMDVETTIAEIATAGLPVTIPEEAFLPVPVSTPVDEVRRLVNERKLFGISAAATIVAGVDGEVCMGVVDGEDL